MAEQPRTAGHRAEDALSYVQDFLTPAEKAEFEGHLSTCAECQRSVAFARDFLPALQLALTPPRLSDEELLAKVRLEHARRREARSARPWFQRFWPALGLIAVSAALIGGIVAAVVVNLIWNRPKPVRTPRDNQLFAPTASPPDAGR
jgi:anti-sigma factor RsiW